MHVLVTGGGGFLGGAIVSKLVARGDQVRTFSRGQYPALTAMGVEQVSGDLADAEAVNAATAGMDAVIHVAARPGVWGAFDTYHRANVVGTENVIQACRATGVLRLVYTSSPSVVFDGQDQSGINESTPYPARYLAHYPHTKALGEKRVLAANGKGFTTVSLRPHLIWGPGDNHLVPRILAQGRAGKLRLVGNGSNRVDAVFVDNAADAHLQALDKLHPDSALAGKAYFITNDEPMAMVDILNGILKAGGLPPVTRSVSPGVAYLAGAAMEGLYGLLRRQSEPRITRFVARQLATDHWFDITAAKRDFDYCPAVSMQQGFEILARHLSNNDPPNFA